MSTWPPKSTCCGWARSDAVCTSLGAFPSKTPEVPLWLGFGHGWLGGCHDNYWSWDNHETMVGGNGIPYGYNRDMDHVGWFLNGDVPVPSANSTRESPLSIDKSS